MLLLCRGDSAYNNESVFSPQPMVFVERFNKTMKQGFFEVAMCKKLYRSLEELQGDWDEWLLYYNEAHPHSRRYCYRKTPMASKPLAL